jgi:hypothetical protein
MNEERKNVLYLSPLCVVELDNVIKETFTMTNDKTNSLGAPVVPSYAWESPRTVEAKTVHAEYRIAKSRTVYLSVEQLRVLNVREIDAVLSGRASVIR